MIFTKWENKYVFIVLVCFIVYSQKDGAGQNGHIRLSTSTHCHAFFPYTQAPNSGKSPCGLCGPSSGHPSLFFMTADYNNYRTHVLK